MIGVLLRSQIATNIFPQIYLSLTLVQMILQLLRKVTLITAMIVLSSCSSEESENPAVAANIVTTYNYNDSEVELARIINEYRVSIGLNELQTINHISYKSDEHNQYMIQRKVVNHDLFDQRSRNLIAVLGAVKVNENVAYNYSTPAAALHAWLESPMHKSNIEGDFTHFGIAVTVDVETGKKYFTNIFIKK